MPHFAVISFTQTSVLKGENKKVRSVPYTSTILKADTTPLWEMLPCHVSITPVPSWKQDRREQEFVRRASGKASIVAALLLPSTTQWGQRERERETPWPSRHMTTNTQTRDHQVCRRSTSSLNPSSQTCSRPDRGYASQQNGIKSRPPQNIIMACKMRRRSGGCLLYLVR